VNLYFDKENGLLIKAERRGFSAEQQKEVDMAYYYSDFKDVGGAKVPHKFLMTRDGEKFVESEASEMQAVGKLDDSVFGKP
jgi:hypothetical protein